MFSIFSIFILGAQADEQRAEDPKSSEILPFNPYRRRLADYGIGGFYNRNPYLDPLLKDEKEKS